MARITINGVSLDPAADASALSAKSLDSSDTSESNYVLVQTDGPLNEENRKRLAEAGAEIHEYVHDDTYLCEYKPADLSPVRALPFVRWANVYLPGFKIPPSLRHGAALADDATVAPDEVVASSRAPHEIDIVLHQGVDASDGQLRERIAAAAHVDPEMVEVGRRKIRMAIEPRYLPAVASLDEVRHVEEVPERQLFNNVAGPIMRASVSLNGSQYEGAGQVIAIADTGLDKGSTSDIHPAFTGRVAKLYAFGRTNPDRVDDPNGHGTHVAGSVLGDGNSRSMGGAIRGTAPAATLVFQSLLDARNRLGGIPPDLHDLFLAPYENDGARVHSNSWGSTQPGRPYDQSAFEIDDMVWNHQDLVICFAAGNDGTDDNGDGTVDPGSIGSEAAAKNCITVGASESNRPQFGKTYGEIRPDNFPANPPNSDPMANHPTGMAAFSSRGPTQEGRIKPDVTAPGTSILSTRSRAVVQPTTVFGTSSDPAFFFDSGTSMATPLTAGCVAVLRGALIERGTANPTAALLKALLVNGAGELQGQYNPSEAGISPNNNSGWGLVDLADSFLTGGPDAGFADAGPIAQGSEDTFEIEVPDGQQATLKITLVWTDFPGAALQNDLDLIVRTAGGEERHGNVGTGGGFDRVNTVEQIVWEGIPAGTATVAVRAFRITHGPQNYAYAWILR
jgi:serine protease AprX